MAENVRRLHPEEDKSFRLAPHNVEAEQALLGAILVNNEAFYRVSDFLIPEHFYEPIHREIYEVTAKVIRAGRTATPITLKTHLPETLTADMSMPQYLARLAAEATTVLNAADYGQTIYDLAIRRNLIQIGEEMVSTAYHSEVEETANKQIEEAEKQLFDLAEKGRYDGGFQPFNEALKQAITMAGEAYSRDGTLSGTATGLSDLDRLMGGLQRSDLVILAARPAMGKTALATNIAFHVARSWKGDVTPDGHRKTVDGGQVGFFSLEMSAEQLATRILAEQAEISSSDIRRGNIHESQFSRLVDVSNLMASVPLYIDDTGGISVAQLAARARRLKRQKGLDLLIVDYLQLLSGSSKKANENRVQELTEITTTLKALAKELEVPIIALSQLSRQVENREDKHPQLADLRESGSIEQDADVVLFVYREEYYLKNKEPKEGTPEHLAWQGEMEQVHGKAEVIIGKQRHGPTGTVQLSFEAQFTRFGNLARADYLPERME
jgi:replicative DNA helicase